MKNTLVAFHKNLNDIHCSDRENSKQIAANMVQEKKEKPASSNSYLTETFRTEGSPSA